MKIAGDPKRQCADSRPVLGCRGQERRLGVGLIEILEDRERLGQHRVAIDQHRHQLLRIERAEFGAELLAAALGEMDEMAPLGREALEIEADAHAKARGRAEVIVELHVLAP